MKIPLRLGITKCYTLYGMRLIGNVEEEYTLIVPIVPFPSSQSAFMNAARITASMLVPLAAFAIVSPHASARPGSYEVREAVRDAQQFSKNNRESDGYERFHESRAAEQPSTPDEAKRNGRLSPEERKALRQQINEAGQDLYYRRR